MVKLDIQWIPWRFICIPLFVQQLVQDNNNENINALHYLPFVMGTTSNRWALSKCRQWKKRLHTMTAKTIDIAMYGVIIWNMILQNIDIATSLQSFKFHLRQGILSTLITSVSPNEMWHSSCKQISLLAKLNPSLAPLLTTWPCFLFIAQIDVIICTYIPLCVMLTSVCKLIFVILITTGIYKPFAVSVPSFELWGISV